MALRILHVAPYGEAAWGYGGIPRVLGALTRELSRRGHRVTVMTTDARDAVSRLVPGEARVDGIDTHVFPNVSNALAYHEQLFLPRGLAAAIDARAGEFDVAHLHGFRNLPVTLAARALRRASVPWVLQPNGTASRIERRRIAKLVWDMLIDRGTLPGAAGVIAVSERERSQLAEAGIESRRIHRVPNPVDTAAFTDLPERGAFRARHGFGDAPVVAYLGKLTPRKRVDVLVEAFAALRFPGARLVIAGNDMGAGAALESLGKRRGVDALFTGLLEGADRVALLVDADVIVYPSQDEIFGLVPLEALLCGTPVLVADDSGCGEILSGLGLSDRVLPVGRVDRMTEAIRSTLEHADDARAQAAAAATVVRERYAPSPVVDVLEGIYREVARA